MPSGIIAPAAAAATLALVPKVPQLERLGGVGKLAAGVGGAYIGTKFVPEGMLRELALGISVGLAVDGLMDLVLPAAAAN